MILDSGAPAQQSRHYSRPGFGKIIAVIATAAQREQPALAAVFGQQFQALRRVAVSGAGIVKMGNRVARRDCQRRIAAG